MPREGAPVLTFHFPLSFDWVVAWDLDEVPAATAVPEQKTVTTPEDRTDPRDPSQRLSGSFSSKDGSCGPTSIRNGGYSRVMNAA